MTIFSIRNFTKNKIDRSYLFYVADKTLKKANRNKSCEISLVIVGNRRIRNLNKKYRGKDRVTDVLSFGNEENMKKDKFVMPPAKSEYLGEIFICFSKARSQSIAKKHSVKKEISILLIHGILHLAGYDHEKDDDALLMQRIENDVMEDL